MTTLNEARTAVYQRWLDEWKEGSAPATPFCFDNETLDGEIVWARCLVRSIGSAQETLGAVGNRKFKRRALIRVELYTEPGKGMEGADLLMEKAKAIFEGRAISGAKTYAFRTSEEGLVFDNRWFLSTGEVFFDYEQVK